MCSLDDVHGHLDHERHVSSSFQGPCALILGQPPSNTSAYFNRGTVYYLTGDNDHAIENYDKVLTLTPHFPLAYLSRGKAYLNKQDYDRAIADLTQALALNPNLSEAYSNRALAWFRTKEYDKAWADMQRYRQAGGRPDPKFIDELRQASGRQE